MSDGAKMVFTALAYWAIAAGCLLAMLLIGSDGPLPYIAAFTALFGVGWFVGGLYFLAGQRATT